MGTKMSFGANDVTCPALIMLTARFCLSEWFDWLQDSLFVVIRLHK